MYFPSVNPHMDAKHNLVFLPLIDMMHFYIEHRTRNAVVTYTILNDLLRLIFIIQDL